nr:uncharacterized protein LOC119169095 [Rhipicephalus microplus]XP_037276085.1 uncharacterized protein LOC119169095 [Rhipicephalus microplus]
MSVSEEDICLACMLTLETTDAKVKCKKCGNSYHIEQCSGLTEPLDKTRSGTNSRKNYVCSTCKTGAPCVGAGAAAAARQDFNFAVAFAELSQKLDFLMPLNEKMNSIEQAVQTMSDHFDTILKRLDSQDKQIEQLRKRTEQLERARPDEELHQINSDLNDLEMRSRSRNLEIHGKLFNEHENLLQKINEIARMIQVPEVSDHDLEAYHRLPAKANKTPAIIIRFQSQKLRDMWLQKRRLLKEKDANIYFSENLTRRARTLLWTVKQWARDNGFRYVWYANGKIFIRRKDGEPSHVVRDASQLANFTVVRHVST